MGRWLWLVLFVLCGCTRDVGLLSVPVDRVPVPLSSSAAVPSVPVSPVVRFEDALLGLHNAARVRAGLGVLVEDVELGRLARVHAQWMARTGVMRHQSLGLVRGPWSRLGENVACGQGSVGEVFGDWWGSRGHRANVLGAGFTRVGFGVAVGLGGRLFWCVVFGG